MNNQHDNRPWGIDLKTFCMLMHLSQFAGYILPGAGLILPIVMWATNKNEHPIIDSHGKIIFNWMLSSFIYVIILISLMLSVIMIIPSLIGLVVLFICGVIFTVIGAIKASDDNLWHYPMSMRFFKTNESYYSNQ